MAEIEKVKSQIPHSDDLLHGTYIYSVSLLHGLTCKNCRPVTRASADFADKTDYDSAAFDWRNASRSNFGSSGSVITGDSISASFSQSASSRSAFRDQKGGKEQKRLTVATSSQLVLWHGALDVRGLGLVDELLLALIVVLCGRGAVRRLDRALVHDAVQHAEAQRGPAEDLFHYASDYFVSLARA
ncbi:hypothetical protein ANO11243_085420 [Dothideomycetidae sp. 11243]|nr:hypothetical protein ANO11243_085420 [fungal sp. No.11243]